MLTTDIEQILVDIFILIVAFGLDMLFLGKLLNNKMILSMMVLTVVFIIIYVLSNRAEYLYNVTLFNYLDRIHGKILKSFFMSSIVTLLVLYLVADADASAFRFFLINLLTAYVLVCVKLFVYRPVSRRIHKNDMPRTVYVGKIGSFNKFRSFLIFCREL